MRKAKGTDGQLGAVDAEAHDHGDQRQSNLHGAVAGQGEVHQRQPQPSDVPSQGRFQASPRTAANQPVW